MISSPAISAKDKEGPPEEFNLEEDTIIFTRRHALDVKEKEKSLAGNAIFVIHRKSFLGFNSLPLRYNLEFRVIQTLDM